MLLSKEFGVSATVVEVALFLDATETAFCIGDQLHCTDASFPAPPRRHFVANADEAHERILSGRNAIVAMSLDDVISLANSDDPSASELVVISGVHRGFLQLIGQPSVADLDNLRDRKVAVDTDTGYASALFEILRRVGLQRDRDYEVIDAGATNRRFEKLLAGEFDATLLGAPFTDLATQQGYRSLGSVREILGGYQGVVLVGRSSWLTNHHREATQVLDSLLSAERWARDPANRERVVEHVRTCVPAVSSDVQARQVAETLFGPASDYLADGRIADADVDVVVDLYNQSRGACITTEFVRGLIDQSYLPGA